MATSPKKLSPQFLVLSMMLYGMEYLFGQFRSAILVAFPPNVLPTPSLIAKGVGRVEEREGLDTVQVLISNRIIEWFGLEGTLKII